MNSCALKRSLWALLLVACADEATPSGTAGSMTMSSSGPTTMDTGGEEESGDSNDEAPMTTNDDDPAETTDEPPGTTSGTTEAPSESSSGSAETGTNAGSVRGVVIRSVEPAAGNDAIGDIYVGLLSECAQDAPTVGDGAQILGADLSAPGATVMYEVPNVPDGTFYVVAYMDDNMNATPDSGPDMGDLVTAEGLGPGCVTVTVAGGESAVAPEPVDLNFLYPF